MSSPDYDSRPGFDLGELTGILLFTLAGFAAVPVGILFGAVFVLPAVGAHLDSTDITGAVIAATLVVPPLVLLGLVVWAGIAWEKTHEETRRRRHR